MTETGPEAIILQVKDSVRQSADFDAALISLAVLEKQQGMTIEKRWIAEKYLELLSFPPTYTEEQADAVILALEQSPSVEKVVAVSAFNLEFTPQDFAREFGPTDLVPDAARRGLDASYYLLQANPAVSQVNVPHVDGQFIVRWKDEFVWNGDSTGFKAKMLAFNALAGVTVLYDLYSSATKLTQVLGFDPTNVSLADELNRYNSSPWVVYAQPDYVYETQTVPNDPIYASRQWSLPKISADDAWSITTGNAAANGVIIAVVDTGADINHPDFRTNLWSGTPQNFLTKPSTTNVLDGNGHGSNVASILGAQGNNGLYMSGVAWDVSLMHLKVFDNGDNNGDAQHANAFGSSIVDGMNYAATNGATAMNLSFGGVFCTKSHTDPETGQRECDQFGLDPTMVGAVKFAQDHNVVAVCAAGNFNSNNDILPISPANVPTNNVISVAASDQNDARPTNPFLFTDYGVKTVDLAAPGVSIWGLASYNADPSKTNTGTSTYSSFTGTSMAAPHVTGTIALLKAKYGWEKYDGLRDRVLMGTDDVAAWAPLVRTGGRLNVNKALHARTVIRNLSTRARVESGDRIMIGGFIIGGSGTGTLKVAIRGLGPSLDPFIGVATLPNPKLILNKNVNGKSVQVTFNDDWVDMPTPQKNDFIAAGLNKYSNNPISSVEAGIVWTLGPGAYTVFLQSNNGVSFGVGLFEIYELEGGMDEQTRLLNVSTRCLVRTGEEQAIAGVILGDPAQPTNTTLPKRSLLMFGKGPSLSSLGVPGALANPFLALKNSAGTLMSQNDSWSSATASVVKAASSSWSNVSAPVDELSPAGLAPNSTYESALWPILKSGLYTATLSGVGGGTGIGLIEMYEK